jgi:hypothetical protein
MSRFNRHGIGRRVRFDNRHLHPDIMFFIIRRHIRFLPGGDFFQIRHAVEVDLQIGGAFEVSFHYTAKSDILFT